MCSDFLGAHCPLSRAQVMEGRFKVLRLRALKINSRGALCAMPAVIAPEDEILSQMSIRLNVIIVLAHMEQHHDSARQLHYSRAPDSPTHSRDFWVVISLSDAGRPISESGFGIYFYFVRACISRWLDLSLLHARAAQKQEFRRRCGIPKDVICERFLSSRRVITKFSYIWELETPLTQNILMKACRFGALLKKHY